MAVPKIKPADLRHAVFLMGKKDEIPPGVSRSLKRACKFVITTRTQRQSVRRVKPVPDLQTRLRRYKARVIENFITRSDVLRRTTSGEHTYHITFITDEKTKAFAFCRASPGGTYSKKCTYLRTNTLFELHIPSNWISSILRRNLAIVGRKFILQIHAEQQREDGALILQATWIEQSRGFSFKTSTGKLTVKGSS